MGKLLYNSGEFPFEMDDRVLAHLRVVFMNKLRRGEPFMFQLPDPNRIGTRSLWITAAVSVTFQFSGGHSPAIDMRWIDEMMHEANSPNGLTYSAEPQYLREIIDERRAETAASRI
jgi:hypothetical protein